MSLVGRLVVLCVVSQFPLSAGLHIGIIFAPMMYAQKNYICSSVFNDLDIIGGGPAHLVAAP